MLITLHDDDVVHVYPGPAEAVRDVEALDAQRTFQLVFDDRGQRYGIRWIRPNDRWWFLSNASSTPERNARRNRSMRSGQRFGR